MAHVLKAPIKGANELSMEKLDPTLKLYGKVMYLLVTLQTLMMTGSPNEHVTITERASVPLALLDEIFDLTALERERLELKHAHHRQAREELKELEYKIDVVSGRKSTQRRGVLCACTYLLGILQEMDTDYRSEYIHRPRKGHNRSTTEHQEAA